MNRREFLKSLAGLGASVLVPVDLSAASASLVDAVWAAANRTPAVFSVASWGTLSIGDYEEPGSRAEMYGIEAEWSNREEFAEVIRSNWHLESIAEDVVVDCAEESHDSGETPEWDEWLAKAPEDDVNWLESRIRKWLDDKPDVGAEYEWLPPMNTLTPESRAYSFFKVQDDELLDALGIVFVEGDHPGSTYFGAEFHGDIDEANRIAESEGIPIRFVAERD